MNLLENISLAINGLKSNKMRALLTMLGIIIGIGSVIAITSVGNAMTNAMNDAFKSFGITNIQASVTMKNDSIYNQGWGSSGSNPEDNDLISDEMIEKLKAKFGSKISAISLTQSAGTGKIELDRKKATVKISGVNDESDTVNNIELKSGRFISKKDTQSARYVTVISQQLAAELYGSQNPVGKELRVETGNGNKAFTIVGVYKEAASSSFIRKSPRTTFYIPVTTAKKMSDASDNYSDILISAKMGTDCTKFADEIQTYINKTFYAHNKTFECQTFSLESEMSQANEMMGTLSLAIAVIAAISLLVGGIGVMNIMLVSVTERTREIGVRKALGAPDSAIRVQFIVESMIICLIGGILGIVLGTGLGSLGGMLLKQSAVPSLNSIVVAVGFSMAIGVFFGYYPANKAAKLDPIEALRYE